MHLQKVSLQDLSQTSIMKKVQFLEVMATCLDKVTCIRLETVQNKSTKNVLDAVWHLLHSPSNVNSDANTDYLFYKLIEVRGLAESFSTDQIFSW